MKSVSKIRPAFGLLKDLRSLTREGVLRTASRKMVERRILDTPPVYTSDSGAVEIRVMAGREDWINLVWTLKSFYHFSCCEYPLYIHADGLKSSQIRHLEHHFPGARVLSEKESDEYIAQVFGSRWYYKILQCRRQHGRTRRFFDFFAMSDADYVLTLDPSIVFFKRPAELILGPHGFPRNRYAEDRGNWYSKPKDFVQTHFRVYAPERINSGLSLVRRDTVDFDYIEEALRGARRLTEIDFDEHLLHTLNAARSDVDFLPGVYYTGTSLRWDSSLVSKQYPPQARQLLHEEGYDRLQRHGFSYDLRHAAEISRNAAKAPQARMA